MDRLNKILELIGVTGNEPSHHRTNLVNAIQLYAALHDQTGLEEECEQYLEAVRQDNMMNRTEAK